VETEPVERRLVPKSDLRARLQRVGLLDQIPPAVGPLDPEVPVAPRGVADRERLDGGRGAVDQSSIDQERRRALDIQHGGYPSRQGPLKRAGTAHARPAPVPPITRPNGAPCRQGTRPRQQAGITVPLGRWESVPSSAKTTEAASGGKWDGSNR